MCNEFQLETFPTYAQITVLCHCIVVPLTLFKHVNKSNSTNTQLTVCVKQNEHVH